MQNILDKLSLKIAYWRTRIRQGKTYLQCLHYLPKIIYCLLELEDISESKVMKGLY